VTGEPAIVYSKGMGGPPVIYIAERSGGTWTRSTVPQIHNFQSFDFAPDGTPVIIAGTSGSNLVRSRRQSGVWSSDEIIGTDDNFAYSVLDHQPATGLARLLSGLGTRAIINTLGSQRRQPWVVLQFRALFRQGNRPWLRTHRWSDGLSRVVFNFRYTDELVKPFVALHGIAIRLLLL
jgi:hypothetical protein